MDFEAALRDVIAITVSARAATTGWRAVLVRERRRLGAPIASRLGAFDLDDDAARAGGALRELTRDALSDVDTLLFGVSAAGGLHVSASASHGRVPAEVLADPWARDRLPLRSDLLAAIAREIPEAHHTMRPLLAHTLTLAGAALTSRFAAELAGLAGHRVIVAFDDDRARPPNAPCFVEIAKRTSYVDGLGAIAVA